MRSAGQPAATSGDAIWKSETVGRPPDPAPMAPKGERSEATQFSIAGADLEMQFPGKLGDLAQGAERVSA